MTTSRLLLWVVSLSALVVLVLMNVWTVPIIRGDSGLHIFDNRPSGYGLEEARAFLEVLKPQGLELYLGVQRALDTVFPVLFAIAVPWALWILTDAWKKPYRIAICLVAFVGPICDLAENHQVARLLRAGADGISADMVARASAFSVAKWVLDGVAMASFVLLSWNLLLQRWRGS